MADIPETDWLKVGFFWMGLGFVAIASPQHSIFATGARLLFYVTVAIHVIEAFCSLGLSAHAGSERRRWFWRTLLLGWFAIRRLRSFSHA